MNTKDNAYLLYLITDRRWSKELYKDVETLIQNGVSCVQLREKELSDAEFIKEAKAFVTLCHAYDVPLIINDRYDIALSVGADGVHLGQEDGDIAAVRAQVGADFIIGASAHSVQEAVSAEKAGASYLGAGCLFSSSTKKDVSQLSITEFRAICQAVSLPVVAIGGLSIETLQFLKNSGLSGVALSSALLSHHRKASHTAELRRMVEKVVLEGKG